MKYLKLTIVLFMIMSNTFAQTRTNDTNSQVTTDAIVYLQSYVITSTMDEEYEGITSMNVTNEICIISNTTNTIFIGTTKFNILKVLQLTDTIYQARIQDCSDGDILILTLDAPKHIICLRMGDNPVAMSIYYSIKH